MASEPAADGMWNGNREEGCWDGRWQLSLPSLGCGMAIQRKAAEMGDGRPVHPSRNGGWRPNASQPGWAMAVGAAVARMRDASREEGTWMGDAS